MRRNIDFVPRGIGQLIMYYLVMALVVIVLNVLAIGGMVWLVVTILRGMGVIA